MFNMISDYTGVPKFVLYIAVAIVIVLAVVGTFGVDYPAEVIAD